MRLSPCLLAFCFLALLQGTAPPAFGASVDPRVQEHPSAAASSQSTITILGPMRSFLRMAGINVELPPEEVLPLVARNVNLQGFQLGKPTEYLLLIRRYVNQSRDLNSLATGSHSEIRVTGCQDAEPLLRILGYKIQGECGTSAMSLATADPEKAFLTADSGFPLVDLEESLQHSTPFVYSYAGTNVPLLFAPQDWAALANPNSQASSDPLDVLLNQNSVARLYWALSRIDPDTRLIMKNQIGLAKLLPLGPVLDFYGTQLCIRQGKMVVPGGFAAEKEWGDLAGATPEKPAEFIHSLLTKDHGWLAAYYDAMAHASSSQQAHFTEKERLKRYYAAFHSPKSNAHAAAQLVYRPASAVFVLVDRMQWDANGNPYVPGNLQIWGEILNSRLESKFMRNWSKHANSAEGAEHLAEAMFLFSRMESPYGPVPTYLCLSELDSRRGPSRRLSDATVQLLAKKFPDFSDQYAIFLEFPELTDDSIYRFLTTAESLNKIPDHAVRGNAMGMFQANIGLWQIAARQGQIERSQLNPSWNAVIKPFTNSTGAAQFFSAGRTSAEHVFLAATGKSSLTQDAMIDLLAGNRQSTPEGIQVHEEVANKIRQVMQDQRLVSIDSLLALDDGLRKNGQSGENKEQLVALAAELHEFEMPQPIFTNHERTKWAVGTYNNDHTETQMKTDITKVIQSHATPKQIEDARGQLATFLRDTLVGMNYAYYEPPGSQALHHNPLFVRSHDFSGDTLLGIESLWQAPRLFGEGSPAGGGAHLVGSMADLPYVLAEMEQDFIAPDHVQALIWQQVVPGALSNAVVPRWWNVSRDELHAIALYQRAGDELLLAAARDVKLRTQVLSVLSDRMYPERLSWMEQALLSQNPSRILSGFTPADSFYLAAAFLQKHPAEFDSISDAARELKSIPPDRVNEARLSLAFGVVHPVLQNSYGLALVNVRPFPPLSGKYGRLMAECWDSANLYWARIADEKGYDPVVLNRVVPQLTHRMVERIYASDVEDWSAMLRALQETGAEFREGKIAVPPETTAARN